MEMNVTASEPPASLPPGDINAAINLRLALLGLPLAAGADGAALTGLMGPILARQREMSRRLADRLSPVDQRIQDFLNEYLSEVGNVPRLPGRTLVLDQPGLARGMSLPAGGATTGTLSAVSVRTVYLSTMAWAAAENLSGVVL